MRETEILYKLNNTIESMKIQPLPSFMFAALRELGRLTDLTAEDENSPKKDMADTYGYIAFEYLALGHARLAAVYYEKAMMLYENCPIELSMDEKIKNGFESNGRNLIDLLNLIGDEEKKNELLAFAKKVLPSSADSIKNGSGRRSLKQDPVEFTEMFAAILPELEDKIYYRLNGGRSGSPYCYSYWDAKHDILKTDYRIDWKSPRDLNPGVRFD